MLLEKTALSVATKAVTMSDACGKSIDSFCKITFIGWVSDKMSLRQIAPIRNSKLHGTGTRFDAFIAVVLHFHSLMETTDKEVPFPASLSIL